MTADSGGWDEHYRRHRNPWAGAVYDEISFPAGARVLEAGCGNGKYTEVLLGSGASVTAVDYSKNAARSCTENIRPNGNVSVVVADLRELPFTDGIFDAVICRHVTGHMAAEDRAKSVLECRRVLADRGRVYFTGFSSEDLRAGKGRKVEEGSYVKGNGLMTHYFTEREVGELFSGFSEISLWTVEWNLRVRGEDHRRAEIRGVFEKVTRRNPSC